MPRLAAALILAGTVLARLFNCPARRVVFVAGYRVDLEQLPADEGGGWIASVPDLPGCASDGETEHEACVNVRDAMVCWWAAAARRMSR